MTQNPDPTLNGHQPAAPEVVRLAPPLIITDEQVDAHGLLAPGPLAEAFVARAIS